MSKIISFDQALNITGYAIFENDSLSSFGKFVTTEGNLVHNKLQEIREFVIQLLEDENPSEIAIEEIQLQNIPGSTQHTNVETFKKLAYVQSVFLEVASELNLKYTIVPSSTWKSTCNVKGRARAEQKRNAQQFVLDTYNVKAIQDICDSICIGHHIVNEKNKEINWE